MSSKALLLVLGGAAAVAAFVFASGEAQALQAANEGQFTKFAKPPFNCPVEKNVDMTFVSLWNELHNPRPGQPVPDRELWLLAVRAAQAAGYPMLADCLLAKAPPATPVPSVQSQLPGLPFPGTYGLDGTAPQSFDAGAMPTGQLGQIFQQVFQQLGGIFSGPDSTCANTGEAVPQELLTAWAAMVAAAPNPSFPNGESDRNQVRAMWTFSEGVGLAYPKTSLCMASYLGRTYPGDPFVG